MAYSSVISPKNNGRLVPRVSKALFTFDPSTLIPLSWTAKKTSELSNDVEVVSSSNWRQSIIPSLHVILLVLWWYVLGSASNNVSKVLLHKFPFPLTLSMMQTMAPVLSFLWITWHRHIRQKAHDEISKVEGPSISMFLAHWRWGILLGVCSICGGVLHRVSLLHMHVSFVHTVKATQPLFAAAIARFWLNESLPTKAYLSLIPIVVGVILAALHEIDMNFVGLSSCLISTFVLCWSNVACKKMMETSSGCKDHMPFNKDSIFYFTSLYAMSMMWVLWMIFDLPSIIQGLPSFSFTSPLCREVAFLLVLNSILTSLQNYVSLCVLSHVTSISHAVATTFKRIFIIIVAVAYFHNPVSSINVLGVVISSFGVGMYQLTKHKKKTMTSPMSIGDIAGTV